MEKQITRADHERLQEIKDEMKSLLEEATRIVRGGPRHVYERAKAYWIGHISTALDDESNYIGKSMCSFQDTIDKIKPEPESRKAYWIGHISTALDDESNYIGKSMCSFQDTIDEIKPEPESRFETDDDGNPCNFENQYKCECGHEWVDWWSCACNDHCPKCNKEIEPFESIEHEENEDAEVHRG